MSSLSSIMRPSSGGGGGGMNGLVFLQSQTVAGAAAVQFTTGITNTYNNYLLLCENVNIPAASGTAILGIQLSIDGGSSYISTGYYADNFPESSLVLLTDVLNTYFFAGSTVLSNMTSGNGYVTAEYSLCILDPTTPGTSSQFDAVGYVVSSTTINAFQVVMSDASLISGTFHLYGYQQ